MRPASRQKLWCYGAVSLFCGLPLFLVCLIVVNLINASEADDEVARQRATLSQIVSQVARHSARTPTAIGTASLYLSSASASLARAEIQDRVSSMVTQAGGRLAEVQAVGTPETEADGVVAIHVTLEAENTTLRDVLYAIESGLPLLEVAELSVAHGETRSGQRIADGPLRESEGLKIEMTVQGSWRKPTG